MSRSTTGRTVAALLGVLLLTACSSGSDDATTSSTDVEEATTDTATDAPADDGAATTDPATDDAAVDGDDDPAVVSLSPTATELLFAIGAGDQVVAADEFSDFPADAPTTELSGFEPNVEAVLEFDPDVVVITFDPGGVADQLETAGVEVVTQPTAAGLEDTYAQALELGALTGTTAGAERFVADLRADLEELADPGLGEGMTYYHEISPDLYTATADSFVGEVYGLFGLENVADEAGEQAGTNFPQLSAESLVEQDPDLVFLACTALCGVTATSFGERDGFDQLTAVQDGAVVELDDDVAGRWGPRVVELAAAIRDAVESAQAG